ncbi:MAG: bifunctional adenosylcobinamide kinase/adenosylcobinamide-phosphate guanylyltransferase [Peptococcaceae bacterium]|nr:bifunctional adenosylcobinamide kinase/adenosylcobinamide-phosphate guanylyltransferase [Peptococcaceae bacterium]
MKGKLILVLGGSRSGKSRFAEQMAGRLGGRVVYIATAAVRDGEMAERVRLHRARRPRWWETVEEEKNILGVLGQAGRGDVFLLDCVTLWLTNLLLDEDIPSPGAGRAEKEAYIVEQAMRLADTVHTGAHLILVSNEVGLGLVPEYPLGRAFRDLAGKVNQELAARADQVFFTVAGIPLEIKSPAGPELE